MKSFVLITTAFSHRKNQFAVFNKTLIILSVFDDITSIYGMETEFWATCVKKD